MFRLCDGSLIVRKKALQLLQSLLKGSLPHIWIDTLQEQLLSVCSKLLVVSPDSELNISGEASQVSLLLILFL